MDNENIIKILYDYRQDIVNNKRSDYFKNWDNWNILHKTISYELSSSKDVESYSYIRNKAFDWLEDYNQKYATADIMNGWWFCFKIVFGKKELARNSDEAKQIKEGIRDIFEKYAEVTAREMIIDQFKLDLAEYNLLEKYLKLVYTIGNMTPAPINPGGGGYGSVDCWEYKLYRYKGLYHDYNGDKEVLWFQDYEGIRIPEKYHDFIEKMDIKESVSLNLWFNQLIIPHSFVSVSTQ